MAIAPANRNHHVLLCNGAPPPQPRGRGEQPEVLVLRTFGDGANVRLGASDITDAMSRALPDQVLDLLELSGLVYAADQCCGRTPGRRFEYGLTWRRDFRSRVAVRCPGFWGRPDVDDALWAALSFLSEDEYALDFTRVEDPPNVQEYMEFAPGGNGRDGVDQVMLMSGGLDSLAGPVEQVLAHGSGTRARASRTPPPSSASPTLTGLAPSTRAGPARPAHWPT